MGIESENPWNSARIREPGPKKIESGETRVLRAVERPAADTDLEALRARASIVLAHVHEHGSHHHHGESAPTEIPPKPLSASERATYLAGGVLLGIPALLLLAADAFAHATALPFDDIIFHGAAIWASVRAFKWLNKGWRGYVPPYRASGEATPEYKGEGFPEASATYATENLRGFYKEGPFNGGLKKAFSTAVVGGALPTHIAVSTWNNIGKGITWSLKKSEGLFGPWVGDLVWALTSPITIGASILKGVWDGGKKWYREVFVDGFKRKRTETRLVPAGVPGNQA